MDKLQAEVEKVEQLGITVTASTPEGLADFMRVETAKWAQIIHAAGIKPE